MKLTMTRVLTPLAALAFTLGAQATAVSTDGFESYAAGSSVTNATGWSFTAGDDGAPDASAVTAYGEAAKPTVLPDGMAAGDNFLKLSTEDGILFRNMDGDAGESVDLYQGLYVDTDVQFTLTDKSDRPAATSDDKFIIWLEADEDAGTTNLCVWAREYQVVEGTGIAANSNKVYKLNSADIAPGSWHRLTVKAIAQTFTMQKPIPGFQVYLDNTLLTSGQTIVPDDQYSAFYTEVENSPLKALIDGQLKFFPAMADELTALSQVGFSGEGAIDNLVVTRDLPGFEEPTTVRFDFDMDVIESIDIDSLGVALTSTNDTVSVASDATFTFSINWKTGYSAAMFNTTTSAGGYATVDGYEVTANGFGLGLITITTAAKDTTDVTFSWTALNAAMGDRYMENTGISFTIGETVYNADLDYTESLTIPGVKTGTNIIVTVTYSTQDWETSITPPECMSLDGMTLTLVSRPEGGIATVSISTGHPAAPVARVGDQVCTTFAAAIDAAKTTGYPIVLCDNITLDAAAAIAENDEVTVDLAGYTITGAADDAVFSNAGTLNITNSTVTVGAVVAGANGSAVANTGTLNLQAGKFAGAIAGGTINVSGGSYSANIMGATCTPGYELASVGQDANYPYELSLITYTITYMNGETELTGLTPATYTVEDAVTLPTEVNLGVVGSSFQAWTNAECTVVAGWSAGDKTGNQVFYAQVTAVVPPAGTEPGATVEGSPFADAEAATNAANSATVAVPAAVAAELTTEQQNAYKILFHAVVGEAVDGQYPVTMELTAEGAATIQSSADTAVAALAAKLTAAATAQQTVTISNVQPGFYYSIESGTDLSNLAEPQQRTLATGDTVELTMPTLGTKGFYRVKVSYEQLPPAPNN